MSLAQWSLFVGALLVTMVLAGTLLGRLPLSSAMVYLALGWLLGPQGVDVLRPDPLAHAPTLERLAEGALLISLFAVGLRLGVPLNDRRWRLPLRLAFVSMAAMVALVAAVGVWLLALPLGAAVLLGPSSRRPIRCWPAACLRTAALTLIGWASAWPPRAASTTERRFHS